MIRINLIPAEYLERQKQKTQVMRAAGVGVLVAVLAVGLTLVHIRQALRKEAVLRERETELKALSARVEKVRELEASRASVKAHLDALTGLLEARYYYPRFMRDIVRSLPSTVWFGSLSTVLLEGGRIEFTASALARSGEDVGAWVNALENNSKFAEPQLGNVNVSESEGINTYSFPVKAAYLAVPKQPTQAPSN